MARVERDPDARVDHGCGAAAASSGSRRASRIRPATLSATSRSASGIRMANSSPPTLATTSVRRTDGAQPPRHLGEQPVSRRVPPGVVDRLEAVEVEHQHRVVPGRRGEQLLGALAQLTSVGQPGELVGVGHGAQPGLRRQQSEPELGACRGAERGDRGERRRLHRQRTPGADHQDGEHACRRDARRQGRGVRRTPRLDPVRVARVPRCGWRCVRDRHDPLGDRHQPDAPADLERGLGQRRGVGADRERDVARREQDQTADQPGPATQRPGSDRHEAEDAREQREVGERVGEEHREAERRELVRAASAGTRGTDSTAVIDSRATAASSTVTKPSRGRRWRRCRSNATESSR